MAKKVAKKASKKVATKTVTKKVTKKVAKNVSKKESTASGSMPEVGTKAPAFSLQDQNGNQVSLADFKGQKVILYFYPRALTPGCTVQACGLRDSRNQLKKAGIEAIGISADPVKKLKQFEEKHDLNFSLLSDPEHAVIEAYGCWGLKKFMGREFMGIHRRTFLIDPDGRILHVLEKVETKSHHETVLELFKRR